MFHDRRPTIQFRAPTPQWGFLPQILEKYPGVLQWQFLRGGPDHLPIFTATPIWAGESLPEYAGQGNKIKAAKEAAAANLANSGHCSQDVADLFCSSLHGSWGRDTGTL
ncbi:hypothetical protein K439DRAFT_1617378 [Ramaria rubella]|nr:hypothetical protein K439DRAFT_1617378 [Ramaria rubella]